jgi:hypothetical protein
MIGLHVRLENRHDRHTLGLGERDVLVDQVDVRVYDGELATGLAAEQIGGAGGLVVQQLSEVHTDLQGLIVKWLDKLSSDLLNSNGELTT